MAQNLILVPVLTQILLTLLILPLLAMARGRSMRQRRQSMQEMALAGKTDWDLQAQKIAASFTNQFELPVLFYVIAVLALISRMVDPVFLGLACVFVVSRLVHAIIHIGPNIVAWRFAAYAVGVTALVGMWAMLVRGLIVTGF